MAKVFKEQFNISFSPGLDSRRGRGNTWKVNCNGCCPSQMPILDFEQIEVFDRKNSGGRLPNNGGTGIFYTDRFGVSYGPCRGISAARDLAGRLNRDGSLEINSSRSESWEEPDWEESGVYIKYYEDK